RAAAGRHERGDPRAREQVRADPARDLRDDDGLAAREHGAPPETPAGLRLHRRAGPLRRAPRRPPLPRRPRDRRRLREAARTPDRRDRARQGPRHQGQGPAQLRDAFARRLSQGDSPRAARRAREPARRHVRRHERRRSGIGSEERAQGEAIAQSLYQLAGTRVPIVATVIGEGGSGGALALALGDRVLMLEHSVYSVASPEGAAAILWGDAARAEEAATRLKLTADDLLGFGIIDEIVPEPLGGAHRDPESTIARVLDAVDAALTAQDALDVDERLERRYRKFRRIGSV